MKRVLVLGSGGREHALVWRLRSDGVQVFCSPGNGGIEKDARCFQAAVGDSEAVLNLVRRERMDLVVVGPEAPLAAGLSDHLRSSGVPVIGPSRLAARLESSKVFSKEFMARHGIPTAPFTVHTSAEDALKRLDSEEMRYPTVVKADGLAAGKGVIIARGRSEAREAVHRIVVEREFGAAGDSLVIEDFLPGREASFIVFTDGETIIPAVPAKDHKAVYDDDRGPNTGGMGAYSTDAILADMTMRAVLETVIEPVINGMRSEGNLFSGMLYAGLMLTGSEFHVLEFNVRMGDPEAQVILPRLQSSLAGLFESLAAGTLKSYQAAWRSDAAVCVVLASRGYPGAYEKGKVISGLEMAEEDPHIVVFHSGTRRRADSLVTDGGRVLGVTATAPDLPDAVMAVYEAVNRIHFEGMHYRRDIGRSSVNPRDGGRESGRRPPILGRAPDLDGNTGGA